MAAIRCERCCLCVYEAALMSMWQQVSSLFVCDSDKNHRAKHVCVQRFKGRRAKDERNDTKLLSCRFVWELSRCEFVARTAENFCQSSRDMT